jgi:hypothetical protein
MPERHLLSAAALGITRKTRDALVKTLAAFEGGKMRHVHRDDVTYSVTRARDRKFSYDFNMSEWSVPHTCGTVACIGGTAELLGELGPDGLDEDQTEMLYELCYPHGAGISWDKITPAQATRALCSYLTTGNPDWHVAISGV